jgi:long-chain acyl-CoA synthetase
MIKASRFVSQVVVIGNDRKFPSALIYPSLEMLRSYARLKGIASDGDRDLLASPGIIDLLERQIDKYTPGLARFEKIKKIALLENELTVESGELTPTLKPRRRIIEQKYASVINSLYEEPDLEAAVV